jgi:hypothetical protein
MAVSANHLRWTGKPGHYEVYYVTLTEPKTGVGVWIRYTMLVPVDPAVQEASCALWFAVMDPRADGRGPVARSQTFPIGQLRARDDPFELQLADSMLSDGAMKGGFDDVWWDLRWDPAPRVYQPINPVLGRLGVAKTVFVLPHADVAIEGAVGIGSERLGLSGVPGGQAHLWGSEHATSWAWARCNDLRPPGGDASRGTFFDGVSALVTRFGRTLGPSTPIVGCFDGRPFESTSPRRILTNTSRFDLDGWHFEAADGPRRLVGHVEPVREQMVGVTYHDPDGRPAYCYNSETASVQIEVHERRGGGWMVGETLASAGRCHFEFGTRTPVPGIELSVT